MTDQELAARIHKLALAYLQCRTVGHAWDIRYIGPVGRSQDTDLMQRARRHAWNPDGARLLACIRCETERIDLCVVGYGRKEHAYRLVSRQYRYPGDYKVEGAHGNRDLLHEELFMRNA